MKISMMIMLVCGWNLACMGQGQDKCKPNPCNGQPCYSNLETSSFFCDCFGGKAGNTCAEDYFKTKINTPKTATQSTEWNAPKHPASNAIDNDPSKVSHTDVGDKNPWLLVDLQSVHSVDGVRLLNRQDCCAERLHDIKVRVGNSDKDGGLGNCLCSFHRGGGIKAGEYMDLLCSEPLVGRYVSISIVRPCDPSGDDCKKYGNFLSVAGMEVYGTPV